MFSRQSLSNIFKRYYTLEYITRPLLKDPQYRIKLADPTSIYSKLFAKSFINRLGNIDLNYGCVYTRQLENANHIFIILTKYQSVWYGLPPQYKAYHVGIGNTLNSKRNKVLDDIHEIKNRINTMELQDEVNKDLDTLLEEGNDQ